MQKCILIITCLILAGGGQGLASSVFQTGGDRLVETQLSDGGWGWLGGSNSKWDVIGRAGIGLAEAYQQTSDADQLDALSDASGYLQSQTYLTVWNGLFAAELDQILSTTANVAYVNTNFYDKLAAGTYLHENANTYDTDGWLSYIGGFGNLSGLYLGTDLISASRCGVNTTKWVNAVKGHIETMVEGNPDDVLGLAGAIFGLAFVGEDVDPTSGDYAAADSLADLAAILAGYQNSSGAFPYRSDKKNVAGSDQVEETAYAVLALNEVNRPGYLSDMTDAVDYINGVQLLTDGWENFTGSGENDSITSEALWANAAYVPEPASAILLLLGFSGLLWRRVRR